jgi:hypothetical protein
MAIGGTGDTGPYGADWNGSTWTSVTFPTISGPYPAVLTSVSCSSASFCMAVGDGSFSTVVSLVWRGTAWTLLPMPSPSFTDLAAVSCVSASFCQAVGQSGNGSFAESWNGSSWAIASTPSNDYGALDGVSCLSTTWCMAVGSLAPPSNSYGPQPLTELWNGSTWAAVPGPTPPPDVPGQNWWGPLVPTSGTLTSVSCVSTSMCQAVGHFSNEHGSASGPLSAGWNGSTWQTTTLQLPSSVLLDNVDCFSLTACVAVGGQSSVVTFDGYTWTATTQASAPYSALTAVSCIRNNTCKFTGLSTTGFSYFGSATTGYRSS